VAIEKDVQEERDRVDELMVRMAQGRLAVGAVTLLAPGLVVKVMGLGNGRDPGRDVVARMLASREIALGAGYLLSKGPSRKLWVRLGLVVDSFDALAGLKSRGGKEDKVPLWAAAGFTLIAATGSAIGAAKAAKDLRS
jgi:hypothetical protein